MAKIKEGFWLFSRIAWESTTDFLDRVGVIEKKPFVMITCPFEGSSRTSIEPYHFDFKFIPPQSLTRLRRIYR